MFSKWAIIPLLLLALFQEEAPIPTYTQEVSVSLINLYASVRNHKGRPVYALTKDDFSLSVDGVPQTITNFSADITEPLNIVFLLDVSGSMGMLNKWEIARSIIRGITKKLGEGDEVALMIFADGEVEMLVDFTRNKTSMVSRMEKLKPYGGTALRNAVAYCSRLLIENVGKKGIVLLSDGVDTRSDLTLSEATLAASRVELPIYTFELIRSKWAEEQSEQAVDELPLKVFADATGGLYFSLDEGFEKDLEKACSKIFEDLKYQYYIGYRPEGLTRSYGIVDLRTKDEKHRVRVRYSVIRGGDE